MGFSNVGLGVDHAMAHTLSAYYDMPHGKACATLLPTAMEFNAPVTGEKYREIARVMGVQGVDEMSQEEYRKAAIDAVKQTVAAEGPRGLYKGMGAPLATVAAFNAVLFTVRGQMEALLRSHPGATLTINQQVVCGAGAGVAVSFLACPTELIKCRLQAQSWLAGTGTAAVAVK